MRRQIKSEDVKATYYNKLKGYTPCDATILYNFLDLSQGYVDTKPLRKWVESTETEWDKPKLIAEVNVNDNFDNIG